MSQLPKESQRLHKLIEKNKEALKAVENLLEHPYLLGQQVDEMNKQAELDKKNF